MDPRLRPAVTGVLVAIAITTAMDASGYAMFSALPLLALSGLFWWWQKLTATEVGFTRGTWTGYLLAVAYPVVVLGLAYLIAYLAGATDTADAEWNQVRLNIILGGTVGILGVLLTEELFFRGWLWGSLERAGLSHLHVLWWTSAAFTVWHLSAVMLNTGFDLPAREIPVYLVNATLLGLAWGMLRIATGSVLVPAVCHALWNAIDYPLFGFGEKGGALGITQTEVFGPEVGLVGIALNGAAVWMLWLWVRRRGVEVH